MPDRPPNVLRKTAKGYTYYYFVPSRSTMDGHKVYMKLPDIEDPTFTGEYERLAKLFPARRKRVKWASGKSFVYFIGGDEGLVKIGRALHPKQRLRHLQMGCPIQLNILATTPGGADEEKGYHEQFKSARVRGEWFERSEELLAEIERLEQIEKMQKGQNL